MKNTTEAAISGLAKGKPKQKGPRQAPHNIYV